MTIKVLIVDPDIAFTVPIKRALEQSGDYVVNVFANGKAAIEAAQREPQDVAILDFNIDDMSLPEVIQGLRHVQPGLFILTSPRSVDDVGKLPLLDAQGSITKPYFARQLGPVIREAMAARSRLAKKELERQSDGGTSKAFSPAPQPSMRPDDTFFRVVNAMYGSETTGKSQTQQKAERADRPVDQVSDTPAHVPAIPEPDISEDATIRDLVSGTTPPAGMSKQPEKIPEIEEQPAPDSGDSTPFVASMALAAVQDDTVPMEHLKPPAFIARIEQELGDLPPKPVPMWLRQTPQTADQPTLVEPIMNLDDTQPSESIHPIEIQDTESGGGIVQQRFEREHRETRSSLEQRRVLEKAPEPRIEPPAPPKVEPIVDQSIEQSSEPIAEPHVEPIEAEAVQEAVVDSEPVQTAPAEEAPVPAAIETPPPTAFPPTAATAAAEPVATLAAQLTQFTVDTAAEATLVTRGNTLVASAGDFSEHAFAGIVETISSAWQGATEQSNSLIRFIHVPGTGDYLLYSTVTLENLVLSMLFPAEMPLKEIRRQAKALIGALENVPEVQPAEPEAATTLPSRPTDLRPPEGLREVVEVQADPKADTAPVQTPSAQAELPAAPRAEGPYTGYSFVWLPRHEVLTTEITDVLLDWIHAIATAHLWQLEGVEIQPTFVTVQVSIPANETPTATVEALMHETAERAGDHTLWADAYYIVSPGRAVTQQEIANFMEYRRTSAQDAA